MSLAKVIPLPPPLTSLAPTYQWVSEVTGGTAQPHVALIGPDAARQVPVVQMQLHTPDGAVPLPTVLLVMPPDELLALVDRIRTAATEAIEQAARTLPGLDALP
jgi:hypothetical protein